MVRARSVLCAAYEQDASSARILVAGGTEYAMREEALLTPSRFRITPGTILLERGPFAFTLDPRDLVPIRDRPIRDPDMARCTLYSRVGVEHRHLINLLMFGSLGDPNGPIGYVLRAYTESEGRIICCGRYQGMAGIHPWIAVTCLCLEDLPPVILRTEIGSMELRRQVPWKERESLRAVVAWASHRYGRMSYARLSSTRLFSHLSDTDKERSVIRVIQRVASKLRDAAATMGVTIDAS